jgi:hypothetical protein
VVFVTQAGGFSLSRAVVNATMVWALLATTLPLLRFLSIDLSRTRELFTVYILFALAIVGRWWCQGDRRFVLLVGVFGAFAVLGTMSWTAAYTWDLAINFWSEWLLASAVMMFAMAFARGHRRTWTIIIQIYAVALAVVQMFVLLASLFVRVLPSVGGPDFYSNRPLPASLALFLVFGFVLTILTHGPLSRRRGWLATFLGGSAILSQHRSVWVALLVVIALTLVAMIRRPSLRSGWQAVGATAALFVTALFIPVFTSVSLLPGTVAGSGLPESATSVATTEWRLEMWQSRMQTPRSPVEWLTGGVFGPTPLRGPDSEVMNAGISGHNVMIDVLTMLGLVGVLIVASLWFRGCIGTPDRLAALPVFLWGLMAYGAFYNWPTWGWGVVAAALVVGTRGSPGAAAATTSAKVAVRDG